VSTDDIRAALIDNIEDGAVAGVPVETLDTEEARLAAYLTLAEGRHRADHADRGRRSTRRSAATPSTKLCRASPAVTDAANATLQSIEIN
jgi:urea transport system permease protein